MFTKHILCWSSKEQRMQSNPFDHRLYKTHGPSFGILDFDECGDQGKKNTSENSLCVYDRHPHSALMILASNLMNEANFKVSRVWFNLDISRGYFRIYWYCSTMQQKITLHCTLAKWDVHKWIHSDAWN